MAKTGNFRGDIIVGEAGNVEVAIPVSRITGTVAQQTTGKMKLTAGASAFTAIPFGSLVSAQLLYISVVNNSTKVPVSVEMKMNGTGIGAVGSLVKMDTFLFMSQTPGAVALSSFSVSNDLSVDVEIEWILTGT